MQSLGGFKDTERVHTPTGLAMKPAAFGEDDYSPVPAGCVSSNSSPGSASDHMGQMPHPSLGFGTAGERGLSNPSWQTIASMEAPNVPRVVSTLLPYADRVDSSSNLSVQSSDAAATSLRAKSGKPSAARRRQNAKARPEGDPNTQRRQKRLERNRESARLSRRRRKQYLEVLEGRVTEHSQEMDEGRRAHVALAVTTIAEKRRNLLESGLEDVLTKLRMLQTALSRTSNELMVTTTFRSQQIKSFALPPSTKFIMWLTLQTDNFFRGGRAPSERLSAARIGERMLNSGTDQVTPSQPMWPLFCSEVGLSYEQEEKVRTFQRSTLQDPETWVSRHVAFACGKSMDSAHDALQAVTLRLGQRERGTSRVLSEKQLVAFLAWSERNKHRLQLLTNSVPAKTEDDKYKILPSQHLAANLYVLNHQFQSILTKIPRAAPLVTGLALKKLSRRPSFESLGCIDDKDDPLSREASFASSGSLKRTASEMSMEGKEEKPSVPPINPQDAQAVAAAYVENVLGHLREIIPPPPVPSTESPIHIPAPTPLSSMGMHLGNHFAVDPLQIPSEPTHVRKSSFLPSHLNVVPEEMWSLDVTDDFLMNLVDEDWAIGEGIDMDMDQH